MSYYVYIIQSDFDGSFYKGFSESPLQRLAQHNNKGSIYTSSKIPWRLVYVEEFLSKSDALKREKSLKKATIGRIMALINHPKNISKQFIIK